MSNMIQAALAWKLAFFKGTVGVLIVTILAVQAGVAEADIVSAHTVKVIVFFSSIFGIALKSIDMFTDQTINNLKKSSDPLGLTGFDTAHVTKTERDNENLSNIKTTVDVTKTTLPSTDKPIV